MSLCEEEIWTHTETPGLCAPRGKAHEVTVRRWPSVSQREGLQEKPARGHLDLGLQASRTGNSTFLLLRPPCLWHVVMAALGDGSNANKTVFTKTAEGCQH